MRRIRNVFCALLLMFCIVGAPTAFCFASELSADEVYCFCEADFSDAQGELPDGIYLYSVPDRSVCSVFLGGRKLKAGDFISADSLSKLTLTPAADKDAAVEIGYQRITGGLLGERSILNMQIRSTKNEAPIAENVKLETYRNTPNEGSFRAKDPEGETLIYRIEDGPRFGTVELREDGSFLYTPRKNKVGEDTFSYVAVDPAGNRSNTATVTVQITRPMDAKTFDDLDDEAQFLAMWMREEGLYSGTSVMEKLCFLPEQSITRGEFLAMTMKLAGIEPEVGLIVDVFADQQEAPRWQRPYLVSALRRGIALGNQVDGELLFRPNDPVTAAEASVIIARTFRLTQTQPVSATEQTTAIPAWAASAVYTLQDAGIRLPCEAEETLNRTQTAWLLHEAAWNRNR